MNHVTFAVVECDNGCKQTHQFQNLTDEQVRDTLAKFTNCHYCGAPSQGRVVDKDEYRRITLGDTGKDVEEPTLRDDSTPTRPRAPAGRGRPSVPEAVKKEQTDEPTQPDPEETVEARPDAKAARPKAGRGRTR